MFSGVLSRTVEAFQRLFTLRRYFTAAIGFRHNDWLGFVNTGVVCVR